VTLMASTIARERESGTLFQLMVTALQRGEIVLGKVLPYFAISLGLILIIVVLAAGTSAWRSTSPESSRSFASCSYSAR
jgi:ABC-2 type transport system permease protein